MLAFVVQIPVVAVLITGLVLLSSPARRLPGRSDLLARGGLVVLLAQTVASAAWNAAFTLIIVRADFSAAELGLVSGLVGLFLAVLFTAGLGLLIAAFATVRTSRASVSVDG
ncbi:hypothetical protein [Actinoplanes solisilvae]|uniref:hypothetical protein n=1 Tax=Actinoplanes solisilvae TaxID=2486853 RepID=UPI000FD8D444|nr:hypothetical protein [Actinoplanes solisilvae]